MFVFISRCSISCTLSSSPARILASSLSIFSICASEASFCVEVTCSIISTRNFNPLNGLYLFRLFKLLLRSPHPMF